MVAQLAASTQFPWPAKLRVNFIAWTQTGAFPVQKITPYLVNGLRYEYCPIVNPLCYALASPSVCIG